MLMHNDRNRTFTFSINNVFHIRGAVSAKTPFIDYQKCKGVVETVVRTFAVLKPKDIHLKKIVAHSNFFHIAENAGLVGTYACSILNISLMLRRPHTYLYIYVTDSMVSTGIV